MIARAFVPIAWASALSVAAAAAFAGTAPAGTAPALPDAVPAAAAAATPAASAPAASTPAAPTPAASAPAAPTPAASAPAASTPAATPAGATTAPRAPLPDYSEVCRTVPCREETGIELKNRDGDVGRTIMPRAPYVQGGVLTIIPGETLRLFADEDPETGRLGNLRVVDRPPDGRPVIEVRFAQFLERTGMPPDVNIELPAMVLQVRNPYARTLRYKADVTHAAGDMTPAHTGVCDVAPGASGIEVWNEPLLAVSLGDAQLVDVPRGSPRYCGE